MIFSTVRAKTPAILGACFLTAGLLLVGACSKKEEEAKTPSVHEVFQEAETMFRNNDIGGAVDRFNLILRNTVPGTPERPLAALYLAEFAYRQGQWEQSVQFVLDAEKEMPNLPPQAYMTLGKAYLQGNRRDDAIAVWEKLAASQPTLAPVRNNLGVAYLDAKNYDKAIVVLEQAVTIEPDYLRAYQNLAEAYAKKGLTKKAEAAQRKAVALQQRQAGQGAAAPGAVPAVPAVPATPATQPQG
ncbi:MAG: tetratricopeptide repeat protein [Nitrospirota bacterium]|nr:tetratricopeptide repeat protein [Nitrospirota bacterium]